MIELFDDTSVVLFVYLTNDCDLRKSHLLDFMATIPKNKTC